MSKTMYIPKGQECRFEDLTCERIVANGTLYVNGKLRTKHISGKGFINGKWITAKTIIADTVDADTIAADTIIAAHINAYDVHAVRSVTASTLITANYVKTAHIAYADAEIRELQAVEAVKLAAKRRGLFRTLLASSIRAMWTALTCGDAKTGSDHGSAVEESETAQFYGASHDAYAVTPGQVPTAANFCRSGTYDLQEASRLANDPEFLRLKAMYKLTQETGDAWQIMPSQEPAKKDLAGRQVVIARKARAECCDERSVA